MKKQTTQQLKRAILPAGKKLLAALLITATFATAAFAGPADVNAKALSNLRYEFKYAKDVKWTVTPEFTHANFTINGENMEVAYTNDGDLIGISRLINTDELPARAQKKIANDYAGFTTSEAIEYSNAENETSFFVSLVKDDKKIILQVESNGGVSVFKTATLKK